MDPRNSTNNSIDEVPMNKSEAHPMQKPHNQPNLANLGTPASPPLVHLHTVLGVTSPLVPQLGQ